MNFISYAQNCEDVVLWRALKGVNSGFYIDVGAADPEEISVTKAFYDRGWSGINIEPTAAYFERLVEARPRDLNLKLAIGAAPGLMVLHEIAGTGLSTCDPDIARRHAAEGWASRAMTVPALTLASICESHEVTDIHFLKVDVEGAEADVLRGMDFNRFRPWIVLVEATEPLSTARTDDSWKELLLGHRYRLAYFDGLNTFYVAEEHAGLADALKTPPNVFDSYVTARERGLQTQAAEQAATIGALSEQVQHQHDELGALRVALDQSHVNEAELRTAKDQAQAQAVALQQAIEEQAAALQQELVGARETAQRARLHAEQLKRRLDASYEELDARQAECHSLLSERDSLLAERDSLVVERDLQFVHTSELQTKIGHLSGEHDRLRVAHASITDLLDAVRVSTSWRLTRPMRIAGRGLKAAMQRPGAHPPGRGSERG